MDPVFVALAFQRVTERYWFLSGRLDDFLSYDSARATVQRFRTERIAPKKGQKVDHGLVVHVSAPAVGANWLFDVPHYIFYLLLTVDIVQMKGINVITNTYSKADEIFTRSCPAVNKAFRRSWQSPTCASIVEALPVHIRSEDLPMTFFQRPTGALAEPRSLFR